MSTHSITKAVETTEIEQIPKRLSRRALIKAAAIAPVIAAGRTAWAEANKANMEALAQVAPIPADDLEYVRRKSKDAFPDIDLNKVNVVWSILWKHFQLGLSGFQPVAGLSLTQVAFDTPITGSEITTGARIADNINQGKFDPLGEDYQTNVCAYICAHKAALLACKEPHKKVTRKIYEDARTATQEEMSGKLQCARSMGGGPTTSGPPLGFGC